MDQNIELVQSILNEPGPSEQETSVDERYVERSIQEQCEATIEHGPLDGDESKTNIDTEKSINDSQIESGNVVLDNTRSDPLMKHNLSGSDYGQPDIEGTKGETLDASVTVAEGGCVNEPERDTIATPIIEVPTPRTVSTLCDGTSDMPPSESLLPTEDEGDSLPLLSEGGNSEVCEVEATRPTEECIQLTLQEGNSMKSQVREDFITVHIDDDARMVKALGEESAKKNSDSAEIFSSVAVEGDSVMEYEKIEELPETVPSSSVHEAYSKAGSSHDVPKCEESLGDGVSKDPTQDNKLVSDSGTGMDLSNPVHKIGEKHLSEENEKNSCGNFQIEKDNDSPMVRATSSDASADVVLTEEQMIVTISSTVGPSTCKRHESEYTSPDILQTSKVDIAVDTSTTSCGNRSAEIVTSTSSFVEQKSMSHSSAMEISKEADSNDGEIPMDTSYTLDTTKSHMTVESSMSEIHPSQSATETVNSSVHDLPQSTCSDIRQSKHVAEQAMDVTEEPMEVTECSDKISSSKESSEDEKTDNEVTFRIADEVSSEIPISNLTSSSNVTSSDIRYSPKESNTETRHIGPAEESIGIGIDIEQSDVALAEETQPSSSKSAEEYCRDALRKCDKERNEEEMTGVESNLDVEKEDQSAEVEIEEQSSDTRDLGNSKAEESQSQDSVKESASTSKSEHPFDCRDIVLMQECASGYDSVLEEVKPSSTNNPTEVDGEPTNTQFQQFKDGSQFGTVVSDDAEIISTTNEETDAQALKQIQCISKDTENEESSLSNEKVQNEGENIDGRRLEETAESLLDSVTESCGSSEPDQENNNISVPTSTLRAAGPDILQHPPPNSANVEESLVPGESEAISRTEDVILSVPEQSTVEIPLASSDKDVDVMVSSSTGGKAAVDAYIEEKKYMSSAAIPICEEDAMPEDGKLEEPVDDAESSVLLISEVGNNALTTCSATGHMVEESHGPAQTSSKATEKESDESEISMPRLDDINMQKGKVLSDETECDSSRIVDSYSVVLDTEFQAQAHHDESKCEEKADNVLTQEKEDYGERDALTDFIEQGDHCGTQEDENKEESQGNDISQISVDTENMESKADDIPSDGIKVSANAEAAIVIPEESENVHAKHSMIEGTDSSAAPEIEPVMSDKAEPPITHSVVSGIEHMDATIPSSNEGTAGLIHDRNNTDVELLECDGFVAPQPEVEKSQSFVNVTSELSLEEMSVDQSENVEDPRASPNTSTESNVIRQGEMYSSNVGESMEISDAPDDADSTSKLESYVVDSPSEASLHDISADLELSTVTRDFDLNTGGNVTGGNETLEDRDTGGNEYGPVDTSGNIRAAHVDSELAGQSVITEYDEITDNNTELMSCDHGSGAKSKDVSENVESADIKAEDTFDDQKDAEVHESACLPLQEVITSDDSREEFTGELSNVPATEVRSTHPGFESAYIEQENVDILNDQKDINEDDVGANLPPADSLSHEASDECKKSDGHDSGGEPKDIGMEVWPQREAIDGAEVDLEMNDSVCDAKMPEEAHFNADLSSRNAIYIIDESRNDTNNQDSNNLNASVESRDIIPDIQTIKECSDKSEGETETVETVSVDLSSEVIHKESRLESTEQISIDHNTSVERRYIIPDIQTIQGGSDKPEGKTKSVETVFAGFSSEVVLDESRLKSIELISSDASTSGEPRNIVPDIQTMQRGADKPEGETETVETVRAGFSSEVVLDETTLESIQLIPSDPSTGTEPRAIALDNEALEDDAGKSVGEVATLESVETVGIDQSSQVGRCETKGDSDKPTSRVSAASVEPVDICPDDGAATFERDEAMEIDEQYGITKSKESNDGMVSDSYDPMLTDGSPKERTHSEHTQVKEPEKGDERDANILMGDLPGEVDESENQNVPSFNENEKFVEDPSLPQKTATNIDISTVVPKESEDDRDTKSTDNMSPSLGENLEPEQLCNKVINTAANRREEEIKENQAGTVLELEKDSGEQSKWPDNYVPIEKRVEKVLKQMEVVTKAIDEISEQLADKNQEDFEIPVLENSKLEVDSALRSGVVGGSEEMAPPDLTASTTQEVNLNENSFKAASKDLLGESSPSTSEPQVTPQDGKNGSCDGIRVNTRQAASPAVVDDAQSDQEDGTLMIDEDAATTDANAMFEKTNMEAKSSSAQEMLSKTSNIDEMVDRISPSVSTNMPKQTVEDDMKMGTTIITLPAPEKDLQQAIGPLAVSAQPTDEATANMILQEILKMSETIGEGVVAIPVTTPEGEVLKLPLTVDQTGVAGSNVDTVEQAGVAGSSSSAVEGKEKAKDKEIEELSDKNQISSEKADVPEVNGDDSKRDDASEHHLQSQDNFDEAEVIAVESEANQETPASEARKAKKRIYSKFCIEAKKPKQIPPEPTPDESNKSKKKTMPTSKFKKLAITFAPTVEKIKCSSCILTFDHEKDMQAHFQSAHVNQPKLCSICQQSFHNIELMKLHELSHMKSGLFHCLECDKSYKRKADIVRHCKVHKNAPAPTPVKRKSSTDVIILEDNGDPADEQPAQPAKTMKLEATKAGIVKCRVCQREFDGEALMEAHFNFAHSKEIASKFPLSAKVPQPSIKRRLKVEGATQEKQKTPSGTTVSSPSRVKETLVKPKTENLFTCRRCGKDFVHEELLVEHEKIHTGAFPFPCSMCDKAFKQANQLKKHERVHTGDKPFQCSYCNKKFYSSSNMKRHERTHTGYKPYVCRICDKRLSEKWILKKHEKMHLSIGGISFDD